jgi:hypothetical protein
LDGLTLFLKGWFCHKEISKVVVNVSVVIDEPFSCSCESNVGLGLIFATVVCKRCACKIYKIVKSETSAFKAGHFSFVLFLVSRLEYISFDWSDWRPDSKIYHVINIHFSFKICMQVSMRPLIGEYSVYIGRKNNRSVLSFIWNIDTNGYTGVNVRMLSRPRRTDYPAYCIHVTISDTLELVNILEE